MAHPPIGSHHASSKPEPASETISDVTRDSLGRLSSWVEDGFKFTVFRSANGKPVEVSGVGVGKSSSLRTRFTYNGDGTLNGLSGDNLETFRDELLSEGRGDGVAVKSDPVTGNIGSAGANALLSSGFVREIQGVLTGPSGKTYPTFPSSSGRFDSTAFMFMLKSLVPNFGSSSADTSVSRTQTGNTYFYDPVRGLDTNTGLSASSPKKTFPQYLTAANSKYLVAAGTTIFLSGVTMVPTAASVVLSVYDGDPLSPKFGQEIKDQPNPFIRALFGGWVSDDEIQKKYFTIDFGFSTSDTLTGLTRSAIGTNSCADFLLRGCLIKNCPTAVYAQTNGNNLRMEDFVIQSAQANPDMNAFKFGGVGVRWDAAPAKAGSLSMTRFFMEHIGEDCIHAVNSGTTPVSITNFAIVHTSDQQKYSSQHCDVFQLGPNPGNFTIQRGVIQHKLNGASVTVNDRGSAVPVGAILVQSGAQSTVTTGGAVTDCLFVTAGQVANIVTQSGATFTRCIGLSIPTTTPVTSAMVNWWVAGSEVDCVWAVQDSQYGSYPRAIMNNAAVTITNVVEIPSFGG